jgi:hypothetical protein
MTSDPNDNPPPDHHLTVPIPVPPPASRPVVIPESRPEWFPGSRPEPRPDPVPRREPGPQPRPGPHRPEPPRERQPPHRPEPPRERQPPHRPELPPEWHPPRRPDPPPAWQPPHRTRRARRAQPARPARPLRRPVVALPLTILFGLLAAFFAWQAAQPLWLAIGHGEPGTATVTRCQAGPSESVTYRCISFEATSGAFQVPEVTLLGAGDATRADGARVPAQMISAHHDRAYAASRAGLHLRWSIGLLLILACGAGIAWATGANRLDQRRSRRRALLLSFAGPLVLTLGFLLAAL